MANHKSSEKRNRQTEARKTSNKYYAKTARNAIKALRTNSNKEEAGTLLPKLNAMLDKLAKKNIIHKNKAANLKSSLVKHVNSL
jgi:small subunit ribosomal protein S20